MHFSLALELPLLRIFPKNPSATRFLVPFWCNYVNANQIEVSNMNDAQLSYRIVMQNVHIIGHAERKSEGECRD